MSKLILDNSLQVSPKYMGLDTFIASLNEGVYWVEEDDGDKYIFVVGSHPNGFIAFVKTSGGVLVTVSIRSITNTRKFRVITTLDLIPSEHN